MKENFFDLTLNELKGRLAHLGKEQYRAEQLFKWVYQREVYDFSLMSNISKSFREEMPKHFHLDLPQVVQHLKSFDGTQKFLFDVGDSKTVETVLIPSEGRLTLCVSSEVGCNMACRFCFTGKQKLSKRLSRAQIVGQFIQAQKILAKDGQKITNVVFMGMGEPLDNPDAVFGAIEIWNTPWGINFSRKRVTVSTSGLVPQIPLVAKSGARLAVSLNATTEEVRTYVMPINQRYSMKELLEACRSYTLQTRDKVTFEYVLLKDLTDSLEDARRLKQITRGIPCKINIIPFNEHPGSEFKRPEKSRIEAFQKELQDVGMHVLLRQTKGRDIYAACGQLRSKFEGHPERINITEETKHLPVPV